MSARRLTLVAASLAAALAALPRPLLAQSQAINGTIEGVVRDGTGAVLPGVTVAIANVDTGQQRTVTTDSAGEYRGVLLSLGTYRIRAELQGFKTVERTGVSLSAGQTALIDFTLEVGGVSEVVSVTGEPPVTDPFPI